MLTEEFSVSQGKLLAGILLRERRGWLTVCAIVIAAATVAGIMFDLRILILTLMITMIVIPSVMALLYLNHALKPVCALNALPHRVALHADSLMIIAKAKESKDKEDRANAEDEGEVAEKEFNERIIEYTLPLNGIASVKASADALTLYPAKRSEGIITIPYRRFLSQEMADLAYSKIKGK